MDLFVRKINLLLIFTLTLFFSSQAQDVRLNRITSPVSGCMLTATEIVTVEIENVGLTDLSGTAFNVSYTINAGAPITENVTFASFAPNTTVTFSFTIAADLSVPGSFTFTATTILAGDINTTNDSFTGYTVVSSPTSVGGTIAGTATVCSSGNAGTLTLSGHTGTIIGWESSVDGGATFTNIANTTTTQNYSNLTQTTIYRASVQSGTCPAVNSATATVTVDQAPVGGTVAPNFVVCSGTNSGTMTLTGFSGTIARWEFSTDGGATYTGIANTTASNTFTNLTVNTLFRAVLSNGVCVDANSTDGSVTVDPVSVGGTIAAAATTVCSSGNAGTLTLSGHTGTIIGWESSVDGGATFTNIANTTTTQNYSNLTQTTIYRASVQSGTCPAVNSATATVTVDQAPVGGTVGSNVEVCSTYNSGSLTLTGQTGTISNWESSIDNGTTWTPILNTTSTQTFTNLTTTTWYRAVMSNGVCTNVPSNFAVVTVNPKPVPNYTVPAVCIGNTSVFTNTSTIASGNIQFYLWDFGDFSSSVSVNPMHLYTAAGSYATSLITISDKGCADTAFVIAQVNALPDPTITASGPTSFCALGSVDLSGVAGLNYLWSTTETTQTITVNTTSMVVLTVTDPITLCQNSDSVQVTVFASPVANAGADTTISLGSSVQLNGSGGLTYYWSPGGSLNDSLISNPIATPVVSTSYQLIVTDANFCTDVDSMRVTILQDYTFTITNAMTPNGDGDNDVWNIIGIENYPDNEVHIYNRYGQEVFTAKPYNNTFDGKFDGNLLPDATYYYVLTFGNSPKIYKGAFTLIDGK